MCKKMDCRKKDYALVKKLATQFTKMIKTDVRFYFQDYHGSRSYDFEPACLNKHRETTLEIINYDHTGKKTGSPGECKLG